MHRADRLILIEHARREAHEALAAGRAHVAETWMRKAADLARGYLFAPELAPDLLRTADLIRRGDLVPAINVTQYRTYTSRKRDTKLHHLGCLPADRRLVVNVALTAVERGRSSCGWCGKPLGEVQLAGAGVSAP